MNRLLELAGVDARVKSAIMEAKTPMSHEDWKSAIIKKFGAKNVGFRETGAHGWDRLGDVKDDKVSTTHHTGAHWEDAYPTGSNPTPKSKLLGSYSHTDKKGEHFFKPDTVAEAKEADTSVVSRQAMIDRIEGYFGALLSMPYSKIDTADLTTIYETLLDHKQITKAK